MDAGDIANMVHIPSWKKLTKAEIFGVADINGELAMECKIPMPFRISAIWKES